MRVAPLVFGRRREIERLFSLTASAFHAPLPPAGWRGTPGRLRQYARFTKELATEALLRPERRAEVERRLFRGAFRLGADLRRRMRVRSRTEAMRAARIVYRGLGIDFRPMGDCTVVVGRCRFSSTYTGEVCELISALDRGLLAGLAYYGQLRFSLRLTDGASECRACIVRRRL